MNIGSVGNASQLHANPRQYAGNISAQAAAQPSPPPQTSRMPTVNLSGQQIGALVNTTA